MNSKLLYFAGGVIGGMVGTYLVMKRRMEIRIEEEVADVKELYSSRAQKAAESDSEGIEEGDTNEDEVPENRLRSPQEAKEIAAENAKRKADLILGNSIVQEKGYANTHKTEYNLFSNPPKAKDIHNGIDEDEDLDIINTTPEKDSRGPYVIEPINGMSASMRFANEEPYFDKVTLFLYDDGILCSEENDIVTNVAGTVGADSLNRIGEYEDDVVYVRNERISTDYEIIREYKDFISLPEEDI